MLIYILSWTPAIILPLSTALQLGRLIRSRSAAGVSITSWALFGVANCGAYALAVEQDQAADLRPILAFLASALLDLAIVLLAWRYRRREALD